MLQTITVWLLMSMASGGASSQSGITAPAVVERFATQKDCELLRDYLTENRAQNLHTPKVGCVKSTIILVK